MDENTVINQWIEATKALLEINKNFESNSLKSLLANFSDQKSSTPKKIDHIGIAVKSIDAALPFYVDHLKLKLKGIEEVPSQKVRVAFLKIGDSKLELLEPLNEESPIFKFIEKKGEGIHHVALAVDDIEERLNDLNSNGVKLIHESPVPGAANALVAFLHPKASSGVLYEFCEKTS